MAIENQTNLGVGGGTLNPVFAATAGARFRKGSFAEFLQKGRERRVPGNAGGIKGVPTGKNSLAGDKERIHFSRK